MKYKGLKTNMKKILLSLTLLLLLQSVTFSQTVTDSIKLDVETARKIALDLARLDYLDSAIVRKDAVIVNFVELDSLRVNKIEIQTATIIKQDRQIVKLKRKSKLFIIFGAVIGLMTQLIF